MNIRGCHFGAHGSTVELDVVSVMENEVVVLKNIFKSKTHNSLFDQGGVRT